MSANLTQKKHIPVKSNGFINFNGRMPANPSSFSSEKRNLDVGFNPFSGMNPSKYSNEYKDAGNPFNGQTLSDSSKINNAQKGMLGNRRVNSQIPAAINKAGNRPTTNKLGDPLFVLDGDGVLERGSKAQGYNVFTLQQLNLHLRKAAEAEQLYMFDKRKRKAENKRRLLHEQLPTEREMFITKLTSIAARIRYIGVQFSDSDVSSSNLPIFRRAGVYLLSYIVQGRQQMFNYWGDVCAGTKVGWLIRIVGGEDQMPYLKIFPSSSLYTDYGSNYLGDNSVIKNQHSFSGNRSVKRPRGIFSRRDAFSRPNIKNDPLKEKYGKDCDVITRNMLENPSGFGENFSGNIIDAFKGYRNYRLDVPSQLYKSTEIESSYKRIKLYIAENGSSVSSLSIERGIYIPVGVVESGAIGGTPTEEEVMRNCVANDDNSSKSDIFNKTIYIDLVSSN